MFDDNITKNLKYYVYRLIDPRNGETFYIGKGIGNRVFNHLNNYKRLLKNENKNKIEDIKIDEMNLKMQRIHEIQNNNLNVITIIHRHGLTQKESLEVEAALIDAYSGLTNVQNGYASDIRGTMHVSEIISTYNLDEANFEKFKILMININNSFYDRGIYEATRYAWRLNVNRAKKADYILAVYKGIIREVFKARNWLEVTKENFPDIIPYPGRYGFIKDVVSENIREKFVNKLVPKKYKKKGASNPIKYSYS